MIILMKLLIALRHPLGKSQLNTISKTLELFPRARLSILHIGAKGDVNTKEIVKEKFGKKCEVFVAESNITRSINRVAEKIGADIVVIGKHRRNVIDSILDGIVETDTATRILRRIRKPVLVIG